MIQRKRGYLPDEHEGAPRAAKMMDRNSVPLSVSKVFQGKQSAISNNVSSNLTKGTGNSLSALI